MSLVDLLKNKWTIGVSTVGATLTAGCAAIYVGTSDASIRSPTSQESINIEECYIETSNPPKEKGEEPKTSRVNYSQGPINSHLAKTIQGIEAKLREDNKLKEDEEVSFMVYDPMTEQIIAESEHSYIQRPMASMLKLFVAASYTSMQEKELLGEKYSFSERHNPEKDLETMLKWSNNKATNRLLAHIGLSLEHNSDIEKSQTESYADYGARIVTDYTKHEFKIQNLTLSSAIPKKGRIYQEAIAGDDAILQVLDLINKEKIPRAKTIKHYMKESVSKRIWPEGIKEYNIMHKSGSVGVAIGDAAILEYQGEQGDTQQIYAVFRITTDNPRSEDRKYVRFKVRAKKAVGELSNPLASEIYQACSTWE